MSSIHDIYFEKYTQTSKINSGMPGHYFLQFCKYFIEQCFGGLDSLVF